MDASLNEKVKLSIQNLRDKKSRIYIIASEKNFFYVNRFNNIYKVFLFKKKAKKTKPIDSPNKK